MKPMIQHIALALCLSSGLACAPVSSTRIGPPVSQKDADCDLILLPEGETPDRPYRDVGMVFMKNCPEYDRGACRKWLVAEACSLGGDVVYAPNGKGRDDRPDHLQGDLTWTLTVAAYISHMTPGQDDPVLNSTPAAPCDASEASEDDVTDPEDQMCTE